MSICYITAFITFIGLRLFEYLHTDDKGMLYLIAAGLSNKMQL